MSGSVEAFQFFRAWLAAPRRVAAVAPSGAALSRLMVAGISEQTGPVIELGPGTGVFTRALIARGVPEENLVLIEYGDEFAERLGRRFPAAKTFRMDAARLKHEKVLEKARAGAVISGLPLLSMPLRKVMAVLDGAFAHLRPDGSFYQFTYGPRCPVARPVLDRLGLKAHHVGHTFANIPPAAVYRIQRRVSRYRGSE